MKIAGFSATFKGTQDDADKIKKALQIKLGKELFVKKAEWLSLLEAGEFYQIDFGGMSLETFGKACLFIEKLVTIVKWDMSFETKRDCIALLQDRGFKKYEELDYVDFEHAEKLAKISVLKEAGYCATVQKLDAKSPANSSYSVSVFRRICEIIEGKSL